MYRLLIVLAYVSLTLQQGTCDGNTNCHGVACNHSDSNSRIHTGKKKPDERSQETADKCNEILDNTIQLFKDLITFFKNYNDKSNEDLQKSIGEMADDGYNNFYKKNEDGNDREYSNMYRSDLRNDVDISNRISIVKAISKRDITKHTSMKTSRKQKSKLQKGSKEKQKPKKSRIMQLAMVGMYVKSIFRNLVKTFSIILQIKLYIMGTILLIVESIRLYLDITRRRGRQTTRRKYNGWLTNKPNSQELAYRAHVPNYTQQQDHSPSMIKLASIF